MLHLVNDSELRIAFHVGLLVLGLATFVGLILYGRCPRCSWLEWIGEREDAGDAE